MPPLTKLYDSQNNEIVIADQVGSGGEGAVYSIRSQPTVVAKVYHERLATPKIEKLQVMVSKRTPAVLKVAAWPVDLLRRSRNGAVTGLLMPRVDAAREAHQLYSPKQRPILFPKADWHFLIWVARNAAAAVETIHDAGHVIGDVNQKGFLVANNGTVKLIDCDSFQIRANGRLFPCLVGVPEFTPPELFGKPFATTERTANHDGFGLAVLIFHLLFMGRHPFAGLYRGPGDMPLDRAIRELRFAYSQSAATKQVVPPPNSLVLSACSFPIAALFERAFSVPGANGNRPLATEWVQGLTLLLSELKQCSVDAGHRYYKALPRCPWCDIERAGGPAFFITVASHVTAGSGFDVDAIWGSIARLEPPSVAALSTTPFTIPTLMAAPIPSAYRLTRMAAVATLLLALMGVFAAFTQPEQQGVSIAMATILAVGGWYIYQDPRRQRDAQERKQVLDAAEANWKRLVEAWHQQHGKSMQSFFDTRRTLEAAAKEYRELPLRARAEKESLNSRRRELQKNAFLDSKYIRSAKLSGIGDALRVTLFSYGYETAADVDTKIMNVPGIGPARYATLHSWRRQIESEFRFDPSAGVNQADILAIDHKIRMRRDELERRLLQGRGELEHIVHRTEVIRNPPQDDFARAARQLGLARANYRALSR